MIRKRPAVNSDFKFSERFAQLYYIFSIWLANEQDSSYYKNFMNSIMTDTSKKLCDATSSDQSLISPVFTIIALYFMLVQHFYTTIVPRFQFHRRH